MEKCLLCGAKWNKENRRGDYGYSFDEIPHLECNINIIKTGQATYVRVCDNKGYNSEWHIDGFNPAGELENTPSFIRKLEEHLKEEL